ncbi:MAG: hypothetical protein LBR74_09775 [Eubacterium sp.]|nr:hypothetical protein [Eubacterium sp.]
MKKRRLFLLLTPIIFLLIFSVIIPSALISDDYYDENRPVLFLYDGPTAVSDVVVWLNGGKKDVPVGVSVDSKVKQLSLYERYEGEMYNITNSKNVKWIAMPIPYGSYGGVNPPTDFKSAKGENCAVSVSKGKVSAKEPGTAIVMAIKANSLGEIVAWEYCYVDVYVGPAKFAMVDENKASVKNLTVGVGESANVYLESTAKTEVYPGEVYKFEFEKDGYDFATFGYLGQSFSISHSMLETTPITIRGKNLKNGKPTKVNILVTALNSGKTAKFSVTVNNPVRDTPYGNYRIPMSYSRYENTTRTIDYNTVNSMIVSSAEYYRVLGYQSMMITDKPKVYVTDVEPTVANMTDAKGNLKIQGKKSETGLTAKVDSLNNVTLTLKKATETVDSAKTYVILAFNDKVEYNELVGCVVFEVDISGVFVPDETENSNNNDYYYSYYQYR